MRKVAVIALVVMAGVVLAASVMAQSAVRDECVALCKDAAKFINEKGLDAAIAEIGNPRRKVRYEKHVRFSHGLRREQACSSLSPLSDRERPVNLFNYKDTTGKLFVQEYIARWQKPRARDGRSTCIPTPEELKKPTPMKEKKSSKKISYVYRVPGKDLMVIAGYFE